MGRFGSPEALARLGCAGGAADSVELKALLAPPAEPVAEALTGRRSPTWSVRHVYLLDTPTLDLVDAGVEIRLRRRARGRYDLAVSARRRSPVRGRGAPRGMRSELDVAPGRVWLEVEVRRDVDPTAATRVIEGGADSGALLNDPQRTWARHGGARTVDPARLRELTVHGPLVVSRVKVVATPAGLRRADLEHFRFPSGVELVELSTHCSPPEVPTTATAFEQLLDQRALAVLPGYRTRTSVWRDEIGCR